jgi:hypothetical protein
MRRAGGERHLYTVVSVGASPTTEMQLNLSRRLPCPVTRARSRIQILKVDAIPGRGNNQLRWHARSARDFNLGWWFGFVFLIATCSLIAQIYASVLVGVFSVASKSDKRVASSDIAELLELLISSESSSDSTNDAEVWPDDRVDEVPEAKATSETLSATEDSVNLTTNSQKTVENRFAAHIVNGMSKLYRS